MTRLRDPIIFIGPSRSGKTTLARLLAEAPDAVLSEAEMNHTWRTGHAWRSHERATGADAGRFTRKRIRRQLLEFQQAHGQKRIIFHSPFASFKIPMLAAVCPELRFVFVHMDGRASIGMQLARHRHNNTHYALTRAQTRSHLIGRIRQTSWWELPAYLPRVARGVWQRYVRRRMSRLYGPVYPSAAGDEGRLPLPQMYARQWAWTIELAQHDLQALPEHRRHTIAYQDMVNAPRPTLQHLADFCELELPETTYNDAAQQFADVNIDQWTQLLTGHELEEAWPILEPGLRELGYITASTDEVTVMANTTQ